MTANNTNQNLVSEKTVDTDDSQLREKVQKQVVEVITKGLEEGEMSEERAREIAQVILEKLPEDISNQELIHTIPKLDDEFKELTDVVLPIMIDYERKIREAVDQKVSRLIKQKKFEEAVKIARKGIDYTEKFVKGEA
jgi:hypothetical protein